MHILIIGGSGFIGTALSKSLAEDGYTVTVLTRGAASGRCGAGKVCRKTWDGHSSKTLLPLLEGTDAIVNLAGENIAAKRWTPVRLSQLLFSRVQAGEAIRTACLSLHRAEHAVPRILVQASAIGYYGCWEDMTTAPSCDEHAMSGHGELAHIASRWEESTAGMAEMGMRRCVMRFAPVLGRTGGMLARLLPIFRLGLGGAAGSGQQPVGWVHVADVVAAIHYVLRNKSCAGVYNVVAPETVSMKYFAGVLGKAVHRPAFLPIPAFALRLALGQMAKELILAGQIAVPHRLLKAGFSFRYPALPEALVELIATENDAPHAGSLTRKLSA